jgi:multidrug efflux system outer membrane protein
MNGRRAATVVRPLTVAVAVALLSGCYSYRIQHVDNPVKLPPAWDARISENAQPGVAKDWWKGFHSKVLEDLIADAQRNNPGIIGTEERLKQAERSFQTTRDGLFPDLSLSAGVNKGLSGSVGTKDTVLPNGTVIPGNDNARATQSTSLGLSSSYTVDLWGATAARYRTNLANFIGTKYDVDLARIQLSANIARSYFNLLQVRSSVAVARENLAIAERILRITQARYDNDLLRRFDLTQQEITVQQQRNALIPRETQMRQAETALALLLGRTPQEFHIEGEPIEQITVPEIAPWLPSELLLRRPDMAGAELDMTVAKANVAVARAALIPVSLTISASANKSTQELLTLTDPTTYSLSGALRIAESIFGHRSRKIAVINAKSNEYIAMINYAQTIRTALKEVDDALAAVVSAQLTEESNQRTLVQTRRALELAELEFREGSGSRQELLDAQRSLFSAQDSVSSARVSRLNAALTLYVALGGGWGGADPVPESPPPPFR